jgi:hypothetical protein
MPYAHSVKRITFSGTSFGGAEQWSTGLYVGAVDADVSNPTQAFADAVRTAWTTFFQSTGSGIGTSWKTDQVKVAQVGTDGKTNLSNVIYAPYGTAIAGTNGIVVYPAQISLVASLENSGARGLGAKGRMYLPGVSFVTQGNGVITTANALSCAQAVKALIDSINAAAPAGERVILASQGRRVKQPDGSYAITPGTAVNSLVNRVRVGTVLDTQRRRRNQLVESYQSAAVA